MTRILALKNMTHILMLLGIAVALGGCGSLIETYPYKTQSFHTAGQMRSPL